MRATSGASCKWLIVALLALAGCRAIAASTPTPSAAVACQRPAFAVRELCDVELGDLTDCAVCSGVAGCIDRRRNVYCVDAHGCDDLRCSHGRGDAHRDDHLLVH